MMSNNFTKKASDIIVYSKEEANRLRNAYIAPEHLLLGILRDGQGKAMEILLKLHVNPLIIKKRLETWLQKDEDNNLLPDANIPFTNESTNILRLCIIEAHVTGSEIADAEHILLAILKDGQNGAAKVLKTFGIDYSMVLEQIKSQTDITPGMGLDNNDNETDIPTGTSKRNSDQNSKKTQTTSPKGGNNTPMLDKFGLDMTKAAEEGNLDPIIGREKEIERLSQILSRRKKNNPVLIGEPGVGKSAIVEGLALRIVQKKTSRILFDKRVIALDMTAVVAGTKYRGQFEERISAILNELKSNPNIIVFIDEIHTIVGAGAAAGSMDAANILKPALARGEIQCVGATTPDEYRKNIEKDGALERRFQKVMVDPTTPEETLLILRNIKEKYEDHHNVCYTDEALEQCVRLTERYITDRQFPDKAIDAIDEAGARVHLSNISVPKEIEEQEKLIEETRLRKQEAVKSQNFELAANLRDEEKALTLGLQTMKKEWESSLKENRQKVETEDIATVVAMMSGVPVQRMAESEGIRLTGMLEALKSKVIAQDKAIETLVKAIIRSRIGLKDPYRPIGTFMFLGPTGVGKTLLAKELAEYMFGSKEALIRVNMTEFMEKFTVSRLMGAPPGYVGYEEGGQLTEKVRRKPYSIILLDEIEKAHPDVFNLLLQIMDEGSLTDSYGRMIDFKNTVIIMTSNIGTRKLQDFGVGVGFNAQHLAENSENRRNIIEKELHRLFAPEFLNRVDEIIQFDPLSLQAINTIVENEITLLTNRIEAIGYKLSVDTEAKNFIAQKGYDEKYGARPLKRTLQHYIEDKLSELIINSAIRFGETFHVCMNQDSQELEINIEKH